MNNMEQPPTCPDVSGRDITGFEPLRLIGLSRQRYLDGEKAITYELTRGVQQPEARPKDNGKFLVPTHQPIIEL